MPSIDDFTHTVELFPTASYQYILYGMHYPTKIDERLSTSGYNKAAHAEFAKVAKLAKQKISALPSNRELVQQIKQYGLKSI